MDFQSLVKKEKEKRSIVLGSIQPDPAQYRQNAPAASNLHRGPWWFQKPLKSPQYCFSVPLTIANRPFPFLFFTTHDPRRWTATGRAPASSYWSEYATTRPSLCLTPNSTSNDHSPSLNCKVRALNHTAHGDSASNG
jgi:hypothetical protein